MKLVLLRDTEDDTQFLLIDKDDRSEQQIAEEFDLKVESTSDLNVDDEEEWPGNSLFLMGEFIDEDEDA